MSKKEIPEIKIGRAHFNNYVVAIVRSLKNADMVHVLARGNNIGKGVIASNIAMRTINGIEIASVDIFDEPLTFKDEQSGQDRTVVLTNIKIVLEKTK